MHESKANKYKWQDALVIVIDMFLSDINDKDELGI